ncbi:enoyl-CoA hydratase/isomerase family protein [Desulfobacula sp.]|uniref:enoyl-CoA hydratase/isomerase family protein n=1 Tax=Desulfobacula sp. TaxID=2593537 RepID=UPI0026125DBE|nr:enoyl-CoA hydratase/isomerase family protein [Desulfobacula sp.]
MENTCPEGDFGFFSACLEEEVLHIRFKENLLEHLINLSKRDMISDFASQVLKTPEAKAILLNSDFRDTGCEAYTRFFMEKSQASDRFDFHRLFNVTSQVVLGIIGLDRIVIHACQGNVISLFLNVSLACDYRIAADNTMFCNPYLDLGLIPVGGGPYFLSRMMGTGNAWETLLLNRDIDAQRALEIGLVDRVVPAADLDAAALDIARKFAAPPAGTIAGLKKLVNLSRKKDLQAYFEIEKQEMFKCINSREFSKKFDH